MHIHLYTHMCVDNRQQALERALELGHLLGRSVVLPPWAELDTLFHRPSPGVYPKSETQP